jgi:hypothetical protein
MESDFAGRSRISKNWLFAPPLRGAPAWAVTAASIAIPSILRLTIPPHLMDQGCTTFFPFVLATSILCGWRFASLVAIGSMIACHMIMAGTPFDFNISGAQAEGYGIFLASSAFMIAVIRLFRAVAARSLRQAGAKCNGKGVVFSLDDGEAWASWYGVDAPVHLGPRDQVVHMMEDFIKQVELGKRFERNGSGRRLPDRSSRVPRPDNRRGAP